MQIWFSQMCPLEGEARRKQQLPYSCNHRLGTIGIPSSQTPAREVFDCTASPPKGLRA